MRARAWQITQKRERASFLSQSERKREEGVSSDNQKSDSQAKGCEE